MIRKRKQLYIYLLLPCIILLTAMITVRRAWQENQITGRILFFLRTTQKKGKMVRKKLRWYTLLVRIYTQAAFITLWRAIKSKRIHLPRQLPRLTRRQALSYVVIIAMLFAMMPAMTVTAEATDGYATWTEAGQAAVSGTNVGEGDYYFDGTSTYTIYTAKGLAWVARMNSSNGGFSGKTIVLGADIDLNGVVTNYGTDATTSWIPIGEFEPAALYSPFKGNFDGKNHIISNLIINNSTKIIQGLFGYTDGYNVIKNVGIASGNIKASRQAGSVVGVAYNSTIENCYNNASVSGLSTAIGGIAGSLTNYSTVKNC